MDDFRHDASARSCGMRPQSDMNAMSALTQGGDVRYSITQKGVDIRIGCDIAALSYKHLVDCIILMSGDSGLVPAAEVARREGIDFILDPMWNQIDPSLLEHVDGIRSSGPKPAFIHAKQSASLGSKYLP